MAHSLRLLSILFMSALLHGCASQQEVDSSLFQKSDRDLCMEYMTLPSLNFYHSDRERMIRARGLNCSIYGDMRSLREKADNDFIRNTQPQRRPSPTTTSNVRLVNQWTGRLGERFCQYSDGSVRNVGVGSICPLD